MKYVALALILFLAFGCLGSNVSNPIEPSYPGSAYNDLAPTAGSGYTAKYLTSAEDGTYVTKSGSITLKVPEGTLENKFETLKTQLQAEGATFSDIQYYEYTTKKQYTITLKVLPGKFESINDLLKSQGELKDMSVQLEDVTQEYTDLQTRLQNKQIELARIQDMYNRTTKISDLLEVESQLSRVETELELLQQHKIYMDSLIQKSTIYLTIYEDKPASQQLIVPFEGLGNLFFGALAAAVAVIVALAGFLIPVALVVLVVWFVYKKTRKPNPKTK